MMNDDFTHEVCCAADTHVCAFSCRAATDVSDDCACADGASPIGAVSYRVSELTRDDDAVVPCARSWLRAAPCATSEHDKYVFGARVYQTVIVFAAR